MPAATACAEWAHRLAHFSQATTAAEADAPPGRRVSRRWRCRASSLPGPDLSAAPRYVLARSSPFPPASGAWAGCAIGHHRYTVERKVRLADRPYQRRYTAGSWPHIDGEVTAAAGREAFEQSLEHPGAGRVIIADTGHQLPCRLPDFENAAGFVDISNIVLRFKQRSDERREIPGSSATNAEAARDLIEILHADELAGEMQQIAGVVGAEQVHHHGGRGPHIFHRVIPIGFFEPRSWPARNRQGRRRCGIEQGCFEVPREYQPRVGFERVIIFAVIAFQSVLSVDALLGADEAELWVTQRNAVVGVPASQHRARHFAGHAADRGAPPAPARRRITDPGLAIGLVHVLDRHPADPVRQIVILRRGHRRRQLRKPELFETRQKALLLLAAKHPEHEFRGVSCAAPRHHGEHEAREIGVIEVGDAAPSQPFRLVCAAGRLGNRLPFVSATQIPACQFTRISWRKPRTSADFPHCRWYARSQDAQKCLVGNMGWSAGASARRL